MAQDYTRQSTFADGDTITAALFNDEYNQLENAFAYSSTSSTTTGHRHDGTAGQGGNIPKIGDLDFLNKIEVDSTNNRWGFYVEVSSAAVEQIRIQDGAIVPVTDNDIDLGSSSLEFKDLYIDGTATIDTLVVDEAITVGTTLGVTGATTLSSTLAVTGTSTLTGNVTTTNDLSVGGNLTVTGNATISGNLTFGDADTDSITLTADVASSITPDADDTYDLGSASKKWRDIYIDGTAYLDAINFNGTAITATAAELNIMDGVTSTASELNLVDGSSAGTIVNSKAVVYGSAGEVNATTLQVGGVSITSTPAELNILDGVTATATEINTLDGITATTAELNYTDGVTSNIQTQLDAKQALDADLTAIAGLANTDGNFIVGNGTTWVAESGATARASLGVTIGSDVLAYDSNLQSFVTAFTLPTSDGTSGQALITNGSGTIAFGDVDSLPTQTGNSGYYLTTDGTNASWDNLKASPTFTGTVTISSTDALTLPVGTTAQRPTAAQGMIRYNTTDSQFEGYNGSSWDAIGGGAEFAYTRTTATATASQTTFSATYTVGYVDVYLNGVKLIVGTDFTATNGTSVVLTTGATVGDNVEIIAYEAFSVANALIAGNNLSDLSSASTALTNLGITSTAAELNVLDGITATTAELNLLDGVTTTTTELNYVDGVTSAIQTQLDAKQASDAQLTDIAGLTPTDGSFIVGDGSNFVTESGSTARTSLGLSIGSDVQAYDANLTSFVSTFTLPTTDGTSGQALVTNGSGTVSFASLSGPITSTSTKLYGGDSVAEPAGGSVVLGPGIGTDSNNSNVTVVGYLAAQSVGNTFDNSVVIGSVAGQNISSGSQVVIGHQAVKNGTVTGSGNVVIGDDGGKSLTSGESNVFLGKESGYENATGNYNIAIGELTDCTENYNVVIGHRAGANSSNSQDGTGNTYLGAFAGDQGNDSNDYNICIGYQARTDTTAYTKKYVIGYNFSGDNNDQSISIGDNSAYIYNRFSSSSSWSRVSDERVKKDFSDCDLGLNFIEELEPVKYRFRAISEIDPSLVSEGAVDRSDLDSYYLGFKAQNVQAVAEKYGAHDYGIVSEADSTGRLGMSYEQLITPLVQAVKELSEKVNSLQAQIDAMGG